MDWRMLSFIVIFSVISILVMVYLGLRIIGPLTIPKSRKRILWWFVVLIILLQIAGPAIYRSADVSDNPLWVGFFWVNYFLLGLFGSIGTYFLLIDLGVLPVRIGFKIREWIFRFRGKKAKKSEFDPGRRMFFRRSASALSVMLAIWLVGILAKYLETPLYKATALIQIDWGKINIVQDVMVDPLRCLKSQLRRN